MREKDDETSTRERCGKLYSCFTPMMSIKHGKEIFVKNYLEFETSNEGFLDFS
jgi:hypothetical protein